VISTLAIAGAAAEVGGHWAAGFGWAFFLVPLFWIGIVILIVSLFGRRWRHAGWHNGYEGGPWAAGSRSAEASLAERFAQGDIDEKEYRARLEVLRANRPQPPSK
jgi:putative membrane protein